MLGGEYVNPIGLVGGEGGTNPPTEDGDGGMVIGDGGMVFIADPLVLLLPLTLVAIVLVIFAVSEVLGVLGTGIVLGRIGGDTGRGDIGILSCGTAAIPVNAEDDDAILLVDVLLDVFAVLLVFNALARNCRIICTSCGVVARRVTVRSNNCEHRERES